LNDEARFSSCGQANAPGFLPYYFEFKKDIKKLANKKVFGDETWEERARIRYIKSTNP